MADDFDKWISSLKDTDMVTTEGYKVYLDETVGRRWVYDSDADIFADVGDYQIVGHKEWNKEGF